MTLYPHPPTDLADTWRVILVGAHFNIAEHICRTIPDLHSVYIGPIKDINGCSVVPMCILCGAYVGPVHHIILVAAHFIIGEHNLQNNTGLA